MTKTQTTRPARKQPTLTIAWSAVGRAHLKTLVAEGYADAHTYLVLRARGISVEHIIATNPLAGAYITRAQALSTGEVSKWRHPYIAPADCADLAPHMFERALAHGADMR